MMCLDNEPNDDVDEEIQPRRISNRMFEFLWEGELCGRVVCNLWFVSWLITHLYVIYVYSHSAFQRAPFQGCTEQFGYRMLSSDGLR